MKQKFSFYWSVLQIPIITIIVLSHAVIIFSACRKSLHDKNLFLSGQIIDDITGLGASGGGSIKVDGYNANATGWFANPRKENIGSGTINADGSFHVSFSKWVDATGYYFYFLYSDNSHINNGSDYLNTLYLDNYLFTNGSHSQNIYVAKITGLQINFQNLSAFNMNDLLHIDFPSPTSDILFGYLMPSWENLQNCTIDQMTWNISGGINASGTLKCNVPADRRFSIKWQTRKNGIEQLFQDSIICQRNTTTIYTLSY